MSFCSMRPPGPIKAQGAILLYGIYNHVCSRCVLPHDQLLVVHSGVLRCVFAVIAQKTTGITMARSSLFVIIFEGVLTFAMGVLLTDVLAAAGELAKEIDAPKAT